jgi:GNAT superfamily N-acetyltransferase
MADIVIRNAQVGDLSALYRLLKAKAAFDGALPALTASESDLGKVLFSDNPKCEFVVADLDGMLVGFAAFYAVFSTYAAKPGLWMDDLFVDEKFRSRGIGLRLLKRLALEASQRGCCKLEWSLQASNLRGIAFYEREGAVVRENNRFAKLDEQKIASLLSR